MGLVGSEPGQALVGAEYCHLRAGQRGGRRDTDTAFLSSTIALREHGWEEGLSTTLCGPALHGGGPSAAACVHTLLGEGSLGALALGEGSSL